MPLGPQQGEEIFIWKEVPTQKEMRQVRRYLQKKWAQHGCPAKKAKKDKFKR